MDKKVEALTKELHKLRKEEASISEVIRDTQKHQSKLQKEIAVLQNQLTSLQATEKNLIVSDHAVLRYAERHYNIPVEKIRQEMADKLKGAEKLGNVKVQGFVVRGHTVVTYVPTTQDLKNKRSLECAG
jgi:septal ring factor EnvC (AmiA/AmiB activator)